MSGYFEELDYCPTRIGALSLRRRRDLEQDVDVYEIKLDDSFLMTSLFTESEIALARIGLDDLAASDLDIAVGGLGLGYTANAVLDNSNVRSLLVIEAFAEVIEWHRRQLVPLGAALCADRRCRFLNADFFDMAAEQSLDPRDPARRFHAILLDIDHSPRQVLHPSHRPFYEPAGLRQMASHLLPGGAFALWSNEPPDAAFLAVLGDVFAASKAHAVTFANPIQRREALQTVYVARARE